MPEVNIKKKQKYIIALKILIAALCVYLLIIKIDIKTLSSAFYQITQIKKGSLVLLSLAIFTLLLLNLSIETTKWKLLVHQYGVSTSSAFKQVLGGIAGGFLSPNRIGDPIVRSFLLAPRFRVRGLLPATICSFSQLLATAIFGSIALMRISSENLPSIPSLAITQFILIVLIGSMIWIAMKFFENKLGRIRLSRALVVVALSLVRYFVFCLELWVLFVLLSPHVRFEPMFFAISLTFLSNAVIPSFSITELGVRAAGAALFFPLFGIDATTAITATILLWFINMVIPSIPGIVIISTNGITLQDLRLFRRQISKKEYDIYSTKEEESERP